MTDIDVRTTSRFVHANQEQRAPARRHAPVRCAVCGRTVMRRSRQQRYCSDRCRDFARREKNARTAFKNPIVGQHTGKPTNPPKKSHRFNSLPAAKSGATPAIYAPREVISREIIAGRDWREEISPDGVVAQVARTGVTA
jgi:predicted nucleic acid-binding Zn ribbon protein